MGGPRGEGRGADNGPRARGPRVFPRSQGPRLDKHWSGRRIRRRKAAPGTADILSATAQSAAAFFVSQQTGSIWTSARMLPGVGGPTRCRWSRRRSPVPSERTLAHSLPVGTRSVRHRINRRRQDPRPGRKRPTDRLPAAPRWPSLTSLCGGLAIPRDRGLCERAWWIAVWHSRLRRADVSRARSARLRAPDRSGVRSRAKECPRHARSGGRHRPRAIT